MTQHAEPPFATAKRFITDHKLNGLNDALAIKVLDEPGHGGACHLYEIDQVGGAPDSGGVKTLIKFQNGPIAEAGVNGGSNEALLAIVIDRMRGFQSGPYKCRDNACALTHLEEALMWLQKRTRERMARGVEGTSRQ
jgi:hypothetical protein